MKGIFFTLFEASAGLRAVFLEGHSPVKSVHKRVQPGTSVKGHKLYNPADPRELEYQGDAERKRRILYSPLNPPSNGVKQAAA